MIKETSLCMGCMNDKTYDGPCRLCGYSDDTPCIPAYLKPKTFLNERYIVGKVISYNGEGATYIGFDAATGTKVTIREFMPDTLCSRKKGDIDITVNRDMLPLYKTYLSEFVDLNKTLMKSRGMSHLQTVLDVFAENNTAYAVFEFINGISLKTYLANSSGQLTWEQIKEFFPPIFTTLSLVHAAGVIHRGISPSTIFVTDKLELKLTGFCISAARTTNTEIACEVFAGYAAPEQYTSNDWNGTWTDVYGIAAVLYRCLTGCTPTEAIARTGESLLEPMMINRNVPANVSKVIMAGLRLSTENRIRNITEFVDKLFEQPKPIIRDSNQKENPSGKKKLTKKQKRERIKTLTVLILSAIVIISFVVVFALTLSGAFSLEESKPNETSEDYQLTASQTSDFQDSVASESSVIPESSSLTETNQSPETKEENSAPVSNANISLPDFTNRNYDSTVARYEGVFTFVPTYEYSDNYIAGQMYDQSIEAGTMVAEGVQIEVKVSKGRSLVPLPEYANMSLDSYISELNRQNIKYSVEPEKTNEVKNGYVARCSRAVGDLVNVEYGETVIVYVAENYTEEVIPTVEPIEKETAEPTVEEPRNSADEEGSSEE